MSTKNRYINYNIPVNDIFALLEKTNSKRVMFFIDVQSICRGLYKQENIFYEINYNIEHKSVSNILVNEYRNLLNNLYFKFKDYFPIFVSFFDDGRNEQNLALSNSYKDGRSSLFDKIGNEDHLKVYQEIKKYYFSIIEQFFNIENVGKVYYLRQYESDMIPYYCLSINEFNCSDPSILKIILSSDKDLLQCCQYENTHQVTNRFIFNDNKTRKILQTEIWNDINAIQYVYPKFKVGLLTSKYIPLILSIKGDDSDGITGIPKFGYSKTVQLISDYNLPSELNELLQSKTLPLVIKQNIKKIEQNYKMISFKEQLKRVKGLKNNNSEITSMVNAVFNI